MSETAQKRDVSDPRTVAKFAELVGSLERLRLLYVLTVADIRAVGPGVWNAWKGQLLAELYHATAAALRGGRTDEDSLRVDLAGRAIERRQQVEAKANQVPSLMAGMDEAYWTGFNVDTLCWHCNELAAGGNCVRTRVRPDEGGVELLVSGEDRIGLFADLVGAIASEEANVVSAQVFTGDTGAVIDSFILHGEDGKPFAHGEQRRLDALVKKVSAALEGEGKAPELKARRNARAAAFIVQPIVQIRNDVSVDYTVVDIGGRDRPGLLYDLATAFADEGLSIYSAHIGSYGERVFDAFYVKTARGNKVTEGTAGASLSARLFRALGREDPGAPKTPARRLKRASAKDSF